MPVPLYPHHSFATVLLPSSRQLERSQDLSLSLAAATWLEFFTNNGPLSFLSVGIVKSYRVTVSPPSHPNHHRDWGLTGLWDHPGKLQLPSFGSHIGLDGRDRFVPNMIFSWFWLIFLNSNCDDFVPELRKKCKLQRVFQLLKSFTRKLFISAQTKLIFHYRQPTENCQLEISKEISSDSNDAGSNVEDRNQSSSNWAPCN